MMIFLLLSCQNKNDDICQIEEGYRDYELIMNGKHISFILPEYYSDTFLPNSLIASNWSGVDYVGIHVFYSTINEKNYFSIEIYNSEKKMKTEGQIDTFMYQDFFQGIVGNIPPFVPFIEKKRDKNGQVYYLTMTSGVDLSERERNLEVEEQHLIYSRFEYYTYLDSKHYICVLRNKDKIKDFSYEEKRRIIESVRIEEIK
jgi:hypothetical protein